MFPVQIAPAAPTGTQSSTPSDDIASASNADSDVLGLGSEATLPEPDGFAEELENVIAVEVVVDAEMIAADVELVASEVDLMAAVESTATPTADGDQVALPETRQMLEVPKTATPTATTGALSTSDAPVTKQGSPQLQSTSFAAPATLETQSPSTEATQVKATDIVVEPTVSDGKSPNLAVAAQQKTTSRAMSNSWEGVAEPSTLETPVGDDVPGTAEVDANALAKSVGTGKAIVESATDPNGILGRGMPTQVPAQVPDQAPTRDIGSERSGPQPIELTQAADVLVAEVPTGNTPSTNAITSARNFSTQVDAVGIHRQVTDHIVSVQHAIHNGRAELEVRLDPPELGKITIELSESNESLSGKLIVSSSTTLDAIREQLGSLLDSLSEAGLSFDDLQLESSANGEQSGSNPSEQEDSSFGWQTPWSGAAIATVENASLGSQSINVLA